MDFGCGEGYGVNILSQAAADITAVDTSREAIDAAQEKHCGDNLRFVPIVSTQDILHRFEKGSFDAIVSFQVIEHVDDVDEYLLAIKALLRSGGKFYCTTPNRSVRLLPFQNPWNKFHIREYNLKDLDRTFRKHFDEFEIKGITANQEILDIETRRVLKNSIVLWPFTNILVPQKYVWPACLALKNTLSPQGRPRSLAVSMKCRKFSLSVKGWKNAPIFLLLAQNGGSEPMCGITGQFLFDPQAIVLPQTIKTMCSQMIHRGPDDEGYYFDRNFGMGMRRLSIVDIKSGHQPICNEDQSLHVVFNGEIYNYRQLRIDLMQKGHVFNTVSDTEVIVHLYEEFGDSCVKYLRGCLPLPSGTKTNDACSSRVITSARNL